MNARFKPTTPERDDRNSSSKDDERKVAPGQAMGAFTLGDQQYDQFIKDMKNPGETDEKWSAVEQRMQQYREKKNR